MIKVTSRISWLILRLGKPEPLEFKLLGQEVVLCEVGIHATVSSVHLCKCALVSCVPVHISFQPLGHFLQFFRESEWQANLSARISYHARGLFCDLLRFPFSLPDEFSFYFLAQQSSSELRSWSPYGIGRWEARPLRSQQQWLWGKWGEMTDAPSQPWPENTSSPESQPWWTNFCCIEIKETILKGEIKLLPFHGYLFSPVSFFYLIICGIFFSILLSFCLHYNTQHSN